MDVEDVGRSVNSDQIGLKRVYDSPSPHDGTRVLVERLWPRGLRKEIAAVDIWLKEIAPSSELRQWYSHDPERWEAFQDKYRSELATNPAEVEQLKAVARKGRLTLLLATKAVERSSAVVLRAYLEDSLGPS